MVSNLTRSPRKKRQRKEVWINLSVPAVSAYKLPRRSRMLPDPVPLLFQPVSLRVEESRQQLMARLADAEECGETHVEWSTAGDEHTCRKCQQRNGKRYTIPGARRMLAKVFCTPGDPDDFCRCCFLPVVD